VPLILAAVLLCLGIALVVFFNGAARVVAGLGTIAISLGITWRSAASLLTQLGKRLEEPIWGAECDLVIGDRITRLPVLVDPPTAGGRIAAHRRPQPRRARCRRTRRAGHWCGAG
jgi:hypothetical protein